MILHIGNSDVNVTVDVSYCSVQVLDVFLQTSYSLPLARKYIIYKI